MKKVKKIIMFFLVFMLGIIDKVYALTPLYGPGYDQTITFQPTLGEKIARVFNIISPILLFIIGLFVVINKRTSKKAKVIIIIILIVLGIFGIPLIDSLFMHFFS